MYFINHTTRTSTWGDPRLLAVPVTHKPPTTPTPTVTTPAIPPAIPAKPQFLLQQQQQPRQLAAAATAPAVVHKPVCPLPFVPCFLLPETLLIFITEQA